MWIILLLSKYIVIGNSFFPSSNILKAFEHGYKGILTAYKGQGFLQAKIKINGDTIIVNEGPQFQIGEITLTGNQVFETSNLLLLFQTHIFNESDFAENIDRVITKYENSGYPYCEVKIDSIELRNDSVNVWLNINEGPLIRISNIRIKGNKLTKGYVILREIRIDSGAIYSENKVKEAVQRVNKLEFVELIESDLINNDELYICIKDKPTTYINGAVGYGKPGFIGLIELKLLNLIGTGRAICINYRKRDTTATFFALQYKEPWVLGYPFNLHSSFAHCVEYSYVKNRAELLLDMPLTTLITITTGISGTWVSNLRSHLISRYREILGIDFAIPNAIHYRAKSEWNIYKLEEITLSLDNYLGKQDFFILYLCPNFSAILRDSIEIYDKLKLGGANTLRGYWEDEFSGTCLAWLNIEGQKFITQAVYGFPFYDVGYIDGVVKQSYGLGIAANSTIGEIKIVYGLAAGNSFMDGKIHLSIKSTF
ncbi:MAG: hypothetical protein HY769_08635 [Candidatus Stahlbacteria bacterium]|nr:hypothetical protein [Candidatus Stahlbacteria bacterium]